MIKTWRSLNKGFKYFTVTGIVILAPDVGDYNFWGFLLYRFNIFVGKNLTPSKMNKFSLYIIILAFFVYS